LTNSNLRLTQYFRAQVVCSKIIGKNEEQYNFSKKLLLYTIYIEKFKNESIQIFFKKILLYLEWNGEL